MSTIKRQKISLLTIAAMLAVGVGTLYSFAAPTWAKGDDRSGDEKEHQDHDLGWVYTETISAGISDFPDASPGDVPDVSPGSWFFDLLFVDSRTNRLYVADSKNRQIDVFDTLNLVFLAPIGHGDFTGRLGAGNPNNGPNGLLVINDGDGDDHISNVHQLWVGDGDSTVKVYDLDALGNTAVNGTMGTSHTARAIVSTGGRFRADEVDYDPKEKLTLWTNDADVPPFLSFISTKTYNVVGQIQVPNAVDLSGHPAIEQPRLSRETGLFYVTMANDNTNLNAIGQIVGGALIAVDPVTMTILNTYNAKNGQTSLAGCYPGAGNFGPPYNFFITNCGPAKNPRVIDIRDGSLIANYPSATSGDGKWFDPRAGVYIIPGGLGGLEIINAETSTIQHLFPPGGISHALAADNSTDRIFVPVQGPPWTTLTGGGGGLQVFRRTRVR